MGEPTDIRVELHDPETGGIRSGEAVLIKGRDVPRETIEAEVNRAHGDDWDRLIVEVQHLDYQPRVMWCSRHGSGFGCDFEGEWHAHWHGVRHNDAAPTCCYTVAMPVWLSPTQPGAPRTETANERKTDG